MSTIKVNEARHLDNSGVANIILASNGDTDLRNTSTLGLGVTGTLTVTGAVTLSGNVQIGDVVGDTMTLTSTVSGFNNFSGFTGEIRMYAGTASTAPSGWLYCNGNTIGQGNVSGSTGNHNGASLQNLFILLSASALWGNSGSEAWASATVNLPDFRSRAPVGAGTGALTTIESGTDSVALTARTLGATSGSEKHALTIAQVAEHTHATTVTGASATGQTITNPTHTHTSAGHIHTMPTHIHTMPTHSHTSAGHTHTSAAHTHTTPSSTTSSIGDHNHTLYHSTSSGTSATQQYGIGAGGAGTWGQTFTDYVNINASGGHSHNVVAGTSGSTTPSATGSTTPSATGSTDPGDTNATDPGDTNSTTPGVTGTTAPGQELGGETHTHTFTPVNAAHSGVSAAGTAHTILSPIIAVNYIIKI